MHDFSDEEAYETIEELQQAAALSESGPMRALFEDTAALVVFLMRERNGAKSTLRYCEGKWSEERGTMLDRIQSDENALSEIIGTDHHNHSDGPPPRYVEIARAALQARFEHPSSEERAYFEALWPCKNGGRYVHPIDASCLRCGADQGEACRSPSPEVRE